MKKGIILRQCPSLEDLTVKTGKLFLVDLAGSEMVGKTGAVRAEVQVEQHIRLTPRLKALVFQLLDSTVLSSH